MAKTESEYVSKATTLTIKASSRTSVKLGDCYYTAEYVEERSVPEDCDIEKERAYLWDDVNAEIDKQIDAIMYTYNNR